MWKAGLEAAGKAASRSPGEAWGHPPKLNTIHRPANAPRWIGAHIAAISLAGLLSAGFAAHTPAAAQVPSHPSPKRCGVDLKGRAIDPCAQEAKATVLIFVRPDCPISNRYAPDIGRLWEQYSSRGVHFWLVYPDGDLSTAEIQHHVVEYDYPCPVLKDPDHALVQFCRARVTPEAAVITPHGDLAYHGRIDDRYQAFGRWQAEASRHDLELAIAAVLAGQTAFPSKPAVGCTISVAE